MRDIIQELVNKFGPSGHEDSIREYVIQEIKKFVDEIEIDIMGNIIASKKSQKKKGAKKIMFAAHMDEIGLIATHIDKDGFVRFATIGGVRVHNLIGNRVQFTNGVLGVINAEEMKSWTDLKLDKLYLDIGAEDQKAAQKMISVGDMAGFLGEYIDLGNRLVAKSMDDRIGCAVLIETIKELSKYDLDNDIYYTFTVQEEVGLRGAKTSAYKINPDLGIALDVTIAGDTPEPPKIDIKLGKGPAIKLKDVSMITSPQVRDYMVKTAQKHKISYQLEVLPYGGTDAGAIQLSREGVLTGCISIPCRYVHSPSEMVDIRDVRDAVKLAVKLAEDYN